MSDEWEKHLQESHIPKLVASTGEDYNYPGSSWEEDIPNNSKGDTAARKHRLSTVRHAPIGRGLFKSVHLSGDGTTLVSSNEDNSIRTFILPPDLLSPLSSSQPKHLTPYTTHILPTPANALTVYPPFTLSEPQTCFALVAPTHLPIRLLSTLSPSNSPSHSQIQATYHLIHAPTEKYTAPHSLLFSSPSHFLAGHNRGISTFDLSRNGEGPVHSLKTSFSRRARAAGESRAGPRGIVSAMDLSVEGLLAAGTFSRWVGVYDGRSGAVGVGEAVGAWDLGVTEKCSVEAEIGVSEGDTMIHGANAESGIGEGAGVTQVTWSACGRYLVVAERGSDGMSVWDVRVSGKRLAWLKGRKAETMQRMGIEVFGHEVWGGGTDGKVRVWKQALGEKEGVLGPSQAWTAHADTVSAVVVHPYGGVVGTASGSRKEIEGEWEDSEHECGSEDGDQTLEDRSSVQATGIIRPRTTKARSLADNSLKIWAFQGEP